MFLINFFFQISIEMLLYQRPNVQAKKSNKIFFFPKKCRYKQSRRRYKCIQVQEVRAGGTSAGGTSTLATTMINDVMVLLKNYRAQFFSYGYPMQFRVFSGTIVCTITILFVCVCVLHRCVTSMCVFFFEVRKKDHQ